MRASSTFLAACFAALLPFGASRARAFTITPDFELPGAWDPDQIALVQQAITDWTSHVSFPDANDQNIPIMFYMISAGTKKGAYIAQWQYEEDAPVPYPYSPDITHFIAINSSFLSQDSFSLDPPPSDQFDMLTAIEHELAHVLGFSPGVYSTGNWSALISNGIFDAGGLNVPMNADNAHTNLPDDLMYFSLPQGVRRDISNTDLQMLSLAYGYSVTPIPEPASLSLLALTSALLLRRRPKFIAKCNVKK